MAYTNKTTQTKNNLESALLTLLEKKSFESITINNITKKADVNRSTFYLHYLDKYDLLEKIEDHIINDLNTFHKEVMSTVNPSVLTKDFKLLDYINKEHNFFIVFEKYLDRVKILLNNNAGPSFRRKLSSTMFSIFEESYSLVKTNFDKNYINLFLHFQVGGFISSLEYWTDHSELKSQDIFTNYYSIMTNGVISIVKANMK